MKRLITVCFIFSLISSASKGEEGYQYLDKGNFKLAYRVFGKGKPVIFLNGGPGRTSKNSLEQAETLAKKFQVVLFDQRGVGRSEIKNINENNINLNVMVEDLEELRKKLNFKKFSIWGHSFGGAYAQAYAVKYPENIEKLILTASIGVDVKPKEHTVANMLSKISDADKEQYHFWTSPAQKKKNLVLASVESLRLVIPTYAYQRKFVPELEKTLLNLQDYSPKVQELVMRSMGSGYNVRGAFKGFKAPTLIIACRQDFMGEEIPIVLKENIPGSRLEFLNECSHYPWYDKPKEFYKLINDFLS